MLIDEQTTVWIDDVGSCWDLDSREERHPRCRGGDFHLYIGENGTKFAMRCPISLSAREKERVFSTSEADKGRLQKYREFLRLQRTGKKPVGGPDGS